MPRPLRFAQRTLVAAALLLGAGCVGVGNMGEVPPRGGDAGDDAGPVRPIEADVDAGPDPDRDTGPPVDADPPVEDAEPPVEDTEPPIVEDTGPPPCTYPAAPHAFDLDRVAPPMSWPYATALGGQPGEADFEAFHCDPEVRSVFIFVGNTT